MRIVNGGIETCRGNVDWFTSAQIGQRTWVSDKTPECSTFSGVPVFPILNLNTRNSIYITMAPTEAVQAGPKLGSFSPAIKVNGLVYTSGFIGVDLSAMKLVDGTTKDQTVMHLGSFNLQYYPIC